MNTYELPLMTTALTFIHQSAVRPQSSHCLGDVILSFSTIVSEGLARVWFKVEGDTVWRYVTGWEEETDRF